MKTKQALIFMKTLSWIIFIGLCFKPLVFIISFFISLFGDPYGANHFFMPVDVGTLYNINRWYYLSMITIVIIFLVLKSYIFYLVIKIFSKFNFNNPFNLSVSNLISKISYVALGTGIMLVIASLYDMFLDREGFYFPFSFGAAEFLFMSCILFIVAFIFKRGVEIQSENELTI